LLKYDKPNLNLLGNIIDITFTHPDWNCSVIGPDVHSGGPCDHAQNGLHGHN